MPTDSLHDRLQTTLGTAYTLTREVGGGGMSRVFRARDVVVKLLRPDLIAGVSAERFMRESKLAASLQQATIVPHLPAGETDGLPYYTTPFVDGLSLRARLERNGALPVGEAIPVLRDITPARAYAHEHGVVHRAIKPDNILLSGDGAVLTDFGIARALAASKTQASGGTLTQVGTSIGTPVYMAPEQAAAIPQPIIAPISTRWGASPTSCSPGLRPARQTPSRTQHISARIQTVRSPRGFMILPTRWMLSVLVTVALVHPPAMRGQPGVASPITDLRIRVTGQKAAVAASGVLPFDRQGLNEVLAVAATDAAGKPVSVERFAPRWTTSDPAVVSLYSSPTGSTMRVVAQQPGRATVTVTVLGKSAAIPVIVGKARETIEAAELTPQFRVARLELMPSKSGAGDADAELTGRALLMRQNGHSLYLNAKAYSANGTPIPLDEFPVTWITGNGEVAALLQPTQKSVLVVGREHGRTTVTATIQGVSVVVETYIGDRRADADPALLAAPAQSTASPASSPAATGAPVAGTPTATLPTSTPTGTTTTVNAPSRPPAGAPTTTGPTSATTTRPGAVPTAAGIPGRGGATAGGTTLAAPSNVRTAYVTGGMTAVRWNPVPGATGYVLLVRSPGGAWAGGNQLTVGSAGVADTVTLTRQLAEGTYELSATAVAEGGALTSPQGAPVTITVPRWSGRYRVTINGIRVNRETLDDPAETDGKRDEVFLRAHVGEFTAADVASGTGGAVQSLVHGDVNAPDWQRATSPTRRVKAGSASGLGGLKTGDVFPASWASTTANAGTDVLPLLVWEGDLYQGQGALMVTPTIWESDQRPGVPATWTSADIGFDRDAFAQIGPTLARRLRGDIAQSVAASQAALDAITLATRTLFPGTVLSSTEPWALAAAIRDSVLNPTILGDALVLSVDSVQAWLASRASVMRSVAPGLADALQDRVTKSATGVAQVLGGMAQVVGTAVNMRDRPIGVQLGTGASQPYRFVPQTLLLTFENVEARLAAGAGMDGTPPGFVAVRYTDGITGLGGQGDYTIYLQLHRVR